MNKDDCAAGIRKSWKLVNELNLGYTSCCAYLLSVNKEFRKATLNPESTYVDVFCTGSRLKHYNFNLDDLSYFQFSLDRGNLRYAYYPNPFSEGVTEEITELENDFHYELISMEEYLQELAEKAPQIGKPVLRYDYSEKQYQELAHPSSHLHIGFHANNRWPVSKVLTPYAFTSLIVKHYYPDYWSLKEDENSEYLNELDEALVNEKRNKCRVVDDNLFSEKEKNLFHIA
ncbi:DUF2290 domain-containing protein [Terasakiella sp. A23]|uniref:DUF2290 domain-containing protein n=1 Tax=Terasakiella sp. FCG-A23 TaxID=3080561 RepID=UPI0029533C95|nr:DUF2290 domain-containing protein [Terasakiella sp. A23]MDV7341506.1 DUF2290 domain-containing protein [Terasakiella sp. A23]